MANDSTRPRAALWTCVLLALLTLAIYWPVIHCEFVDYDDDIYVTKNPDIQAGVTPASLRWAFTSNYAANWHPLTWLTHMIDYQLFDLNPAGHHAVNLALHILNVVLLFCVLRCMTGAVGRSAFVAGLFALHPLHVESVAWIAERKDVLSTCFGLLTIWAYARYAGTLRNGEGVKENTQRVLQDEQSVPGASVARSTFRIPRSTFYYLLTLLCFALSLMSKPMLVTMPFVLWLVDIWPLRRVSSFGFLASGWKSSNPKLEARDSRLRIILEKVPLLMMSAVSCVLTLWAQTIAMRGLENVSMSSRLANAVVACFRYIQEMFWPAPLVILKPLQAVATGEFIVALIVLAGFTYFVLRQFRMRPYLFAGWFWYLGMLVPVIGLVQVGFQAVADRYTYLPLVGLFIVIAWGGVDLARHWRVPAPVLRAAALLGIAACIPVTRAQLKHWQNSVTLFEHALSWTTDNFLIEYDLAKAFMRMGRFEEARQHMAEAVRILPEHPETHRGLGMVLMEQRRFAEAANELNQALQLKSDLWKARAMLAQALLEQGKTAEALGHFSEVIRLNPTNTEIRSYYAMALAHQGRVRDAIEEYRVVLKLCPATPGVLNNLAWVLATHPEDGVRNGQEAIRLAEQACRINGYRDPALLSTLAVAYAEAGEFDRAVEMALRAETLAEAVGNKRLAEQNRNRADLFLREQPFRDVTPPALSSPSSSSSPSSPPPSSSSSSPSNR